MPCCTGSAARGSDVEASLTLRGDALPIKRLMLQLADLEELLDAQQIELTGDVTALNSLFDMLDEFPRRFPIISPRPD